MAIYHASFQVIKRSAGRSTLAASAYRSGERIVNEQSGEIHHYRNKSDDVDDAFILRPSDSPDWAEDRAQLWNTVERVEKRKDAQLARELVVALPKELNNNESRAMLEGFVKSSFVDKGMVADVVMHNLDSDNPHAHVMLTMREISRESGFGKKNRDWNEKSQLQSWRQEWETSVNQKLEAAGHDARIDHRSLAAQGIEGDPTIHLGYKASKLEKAGKQTLKGDLNRAILKDRNDLKQLGDMMKMLNQQAVELKKRISEKLSISAASAQKIFADIAKESGAALPKPEQVVREEKKLTPDTDKRRTREGPSHGY